MTPKLRSSGSKASENPIQFSSRYRDEETGLIYFGFRYYSPELGRWISRDPLGEDGGLNLYAFVGNNALQYYDPNGLFYKYQQIRQLGGGEGVLEINGRKYDFGSKSELVAALKYFPQNERIQTFVYTGHGSPGIGALAPSAKKDASVLIFANDIAEILSRYKSRFVDNPTIEFNACGSANPNTPSVAEMTKNAFPNATVVGYTGLNLFGFGVPNNRYFNNFGAPLPGVPSKSERVVLR